MTMLSVLVLALAACGGSTARERGAARSTTTTTPPCDVPLDGRCLGTDQACKTYLSIVGDFTMSDEASALRLSDLAASTADRGLSAALSEMGDAFARHDASIPSDEVQARC